MDKYDSIDLDILQELNSDFKKSLAEVGKKVGLSHAAVKYRIDQMRSKDLISRSYNLNINKLNLQFFCLIMHVNEKERLKEEFSNCPKVMAYYDTIGDYNLMILLLVENLQTAEAMLSHCPLFSGWSIQKKVLLPLLNYSRKYRQINLSYREKGKKNPCKKMDSKFCLKCEAYKQGRCCGCPTMPGYKGNFK
ncbi:AsnC family transcriptional regulator [Candidatus Woesearchaeota archaeon]|nr:AsnC family transcriptional regulator [Candidatus Woesearchaeota archaeon]